MPNNRNRKLCVWYTSMCRFNFMSAHREIHLKQTLWKFKLKTVAHKRKIYLSRRDAVVFVCLIRCVRVSRCKLFLTIHTGNIAGVLVIQFNRKISKPTWIFHGKKPPFQFLKKTYWRDGKRANYSTTSTKNQLVFNSIKLKTFGNGSELAERYAT